MTSTELKPIVTFRTNFPANIMGELIVGSVKRRIKFVPAERSGYVSTVNIIRPVIAVCCSGLLASFVGGERFHHLFLRPGIATFTAYFLIETSASKKEVKKPGRFGGRG